VIGAPATVQAAAGSRQEISARQLVQLHLEHLERWNPTINAVVTVAVDQAAAADERPVG